MDKEALPENFYKYGSMQRPEYLKEVLLENKIYFSSPFDFNDPFDSRPKLVIGNSLQEIKKSRRGIMDWLRKIKGLDRNARRKEADRMMKNFQNPHTLREIFDTITSPLGVYCLTEKKDNLLMWAHYASDNTGYVIGFDEPNLFLNQNDLEGNHVYPYKVTYSDNRQFVKFEEPNWKEKLLCQKPIEWAYEQEERFFLSGMDLSNSMIVDKFGAKIVLYDLSPTSILKVFIGCKASSKTRERIIKAIKKHSLNCAVYQATISKAEYKLNFHQIHAYRDREESHNSPLPHHQDKRVRIRRFG